MFRLLTVGEPLEMDEDAALEKPDRDGLGCADEVEGPCPEASLRRSSSSSFSSSSYRPEMESQSEILKFRLQS
jgi:hypothetical protein